MKRKEIAFQPVFFVILAAGFAHFLNLGAESNSFTIIDHSFRFDWSSFLLSFLGLFLFLMLVWISLAKLEAKAFLQTVQTRRRTGLAVFWPLLFFWLAPFLLSFYLTKEDLNLRLTLLAIFIGIALIYLKMVDLWQHARGITGLIQKWESRWSALPTKRKLLCLFLVSFALYNLCTFIFVQEGFTFSGDEPNYLLTTHSLLYDKDINLANNYANKDYFHFYSKKDNPLLKLGIYGRYGRKGHDYIFPINLPGVSVLMLPWYWLSQHFEGKTLTFILKGSLSIWAVLLGLQLYLLAGQLWKKERVSVALWFLFSFSAPILFYATHLYPEVPIALFSLFIYRKVTSPGKISLFNYFFLGFLLAVFFWFGVKYNFLFWPLLLLSIYYLHKHHQARWKIAYFLILPALSFFLFYFFTYSLYGTFSPFSIYEGVMTPERLQAFKEAVLSLPLLQRIDSFFDYFLDQRDGLLLYAPLYFFVFLGFVEIFRKSKRDFLFFLFLVLPYLLNYAFFTHRQGYSPQGRVLAPISWIGAIAIGYFLVENRKKIFAFFFWFLSLASLVLAGLLLLHPSFLYQPTTHEFTSRPGDLFVHLSNIHFFLPAFLPSFIKVDNVGYWPNYLWVIAVATFIMLYIFLKAKENPSLRPAFHNIFGLVLLSGASFLWVLYPRPALHQTHTVFYSPQKAMGFYLFPMGTGVVAKKTGELYLHEEKTYKVLFSSRRRLDKVKVIFGSEKGEYEAGLRFFDIPLFEGRTNFEKKELTLTPPAYYGFKNLFLYELELSIKKRSSESMLVDPYLLSIVPEK